MCVCVYVCVCICVTLYYLPFSSVTAAPADAVYPDTVALSIDDEACKLTCIYNDHSLYIWDIHDIKRIGKCRSFLYHSSAIWGLEVSAVVIYLAEVNMQM